MTRRERRNGGGGEGSSRLEDTAPSVTLSSPDRAMPAPPPALSAPDDSDDSDDSGAVQPILQDGEMVSGRYRIACFLAQGGMGQIFEAEDLILQERVALKLLRPELAREPRWLERFKREIQLARKVTHHNVCRIFEVGFHRGPKGESRGEVPFLSMELLLGETLAERLQRVGRFGTEEALPLVLQLVAGLQAAHDVGVVHRDLKTRNIILVPGEGRAGARVVITDFGIARFTAAPKTARDLTQTGDVLGTPAYMAPEQVLGEEITAAADIYALGVVLYEMVTGTRPFDGNTPLSVATRRIVQPAPSARTLVPDLAPRWDSVILRCLERRPQDRYARVSDVASVLASPQAQPPGDPPTPTTGTNPAPGAPQQETRTSAPRVPLQRPDARYSAAWYVRRERAEKDALAYLEDPGIPACLWGPERFGKTWLLEHLLAEFRRRRDGDCTIIQVNLHAISQEQRASFDSFLLALGLDLVADEPDGDALVERAFGLASAAPNDKLRRLVRELLQRTSGPLVVAIDHADTVLGQPYSDSFFGMLRAWAENTREPWTRLRLILAVSTTPMRLTENIHNSPFRNLSEPIELDELDAEQLGELARRHGLPWGAEEIERLTGLVGGHPYLARLAMYQAAQHGIPLTKILTGSGDAGPFEEHLRVCRSFLRSRPALAEALRSLGPEGTDTIDPQTYEELRRAGLVHYKNDRYRLRCRLYSWLL